MWGETCKSLVFNTMCGGRLVNPLYLIQAIKQDHGLDLAKLMDSSVYKEKYRQDMITWGEMMRDKDPAYFCHLATEGADKPVWLVCDARRPSDMSYFKSKYEGGTLCVRVVASDGVRVGRGWEFTPGVDDAPSECALDNYQVDMTIVNDDGDDLSQPLEAIITKIKQSTM